MAKLHWVILVFAVGLGVLTGWYWDHIPPEVPWLYSLPWGEQQLLKKEWWVMGLGVATLVWLGVVKTIKVVAKEDEQIRSILIWMITLVLTLYLVSYYQVWRVVVMV